MRIVHISGRHILALKQFDFDVKGPLTVISGRNGVGKTAILSALVGAFEGGSLATLVKEGEDEAQVVVTFEDGSSHVTDIERDGKTERKVLLPSGKRAGDTATRWADKNVNLSFFSPIDFIEAKPDKQLQMVLEVSELELEAEALVAAAAPYTEFTDLLKSQTGRVDEPLQVIDMVTKRIKEYRTEVNRSIRDKEGSIRDDLDAMGPLPEGGGDPKPLRVELAALQQRLTERKAEAKLTEKDANANLNVKSTAFGNAALDEYANAEKAAAALRDKKIAEANAEYAAGEKAAAKTRDDKVEAGRKRLEKVTADNATAKQAAIDAADAELGPLIAKLNTAIGQAEQAERGAIVRQETENRIAQKRKMKKEQEEEAESLTKALKRLDDLSVQTMERLPVKGLKFRDGELYWGQPQVRLQTLNSAALLDVAFRIAEAASSRYPVKFICMDGLERLDADSYAAFEKRAAGGEYQYFCTTVASGQPLTVSSNGSKA